MVDVWGKVVGEAFVPIDDRGRDILRMAGQKGVNVKADFVLPRNGRFHRLYFVLLTMVYENVPDEVTKIYPTIDDFHDAIKIIAGLRKRIVLPASIRSEDGTIIIPAGTVAFKAGSIAWNKLDEHTFSIFFDRVCDIVIRYFWPTVDNAWIRREVERIAGAKIGG